MPDTGANGQRAAAGGSSIESIRGGIEPAKGNARVVVAMTSNPGCLRRRIIDAARIPASTLADVAQVPSNRGQSPFAIASGNMFEAFLKKDKCAGLVEALAPLVELPPEGKRVVTDCGDWKIGNEARVAKTRKLLKKMATGAKGAPDLLDHPMLALDVGGTRIYLEPDALAIKTPMGLQLIEIKSFAIIDGQGDAGKQASAAGQSAVYLWALKQTLEAEGLDPDLVLWSVILVAPKNFGRTATAHVIPLKTKAASIARVLARAGSPEDLSAAIPEGFTFDVDPHESLDADKRAERMRAALNQFPCRFVPECMASCDLAMFCRDEAIRTDSPARLGRQARDLVGDIPTITQALDLAQRGSASAQPEFADVAEALHEGAGAILRARKAAPPTCGLAASKPRKRARA